VEFIKKYFEQRKDAPQAQEPGLTIKPEIWNSLTKAEQDSRNKAFSGVLVKAEETKIS
jgi:hypothetical protein